MKKKNDYVEYLDKRIELLTTSHKEYQEVAISTDNDEFSKAYSSIASGLWDQVTELKKAKAQYLLTHQVIGI